MLIGNGEERTQIQAARQLAGWMEADGWEVRIEPIPGQFVHIDVLVSILAPKLAAVCVEAASGGLVAWLRGPRLRDPRGLARGRLQPRRQRDLARRRPGDLDQGSAELNEQLRALGLEVFDPDLSMFTKGGGGAHCLAQALRRDRAVEPWRRRRSTRPGDRRPARARRAHLRRAAAPSGCAGRRPGATPARSSAERLDELGLESELAEERLAGPGIRRQRRRRALAEAMPTNGKTSVERIAAPTRPAEVEARMWPASTASVVIATTSGSSVAQKKARASAVARHRARCGRAAAPGRRGRRGRGRRTSPASPGRRPEPQRVEVEGHAAGDEEEGDQEAVADRGQLRVEDWTSWPFTARRVISPATKPPSSRSSPSLWRARRGRRRGRRRAARRPGRSTRSSAPAAASRARPSARRRGR